MSELPVEQQFLEHIVKLIVTKPEAVEITRTVDDLGTLLTLKVDKEDMGRIIGKDGQTAKSIRTMLRVIGSRNEQRVNLKVLEPEGSDRGNFEAPSSDEHSSEAPEQTSSTNVDDIDLGDDIDI